MSERSRAGRGPCRHRRAGRSARPPAPAGAGRGNEECRVDDADITELALRARDGHRDAAGAFVAATQQQVWRLLVHLADVSVAEELAQETYERALGSLRRYRGDAPARSWLLSIARRGAAGHLRRRARRPVSPAPVAEDDRPGAPPPR